MRIKSSKRSCCPQFRVRIKAPAERIQSSAMVVGNRIFPAFGLTSVALLVITNKNYKTKLLMGMGVKWAFL